VVWQPLVVLVEVGKREPLLGHIPVGILDAHLMLPVDSALSTVPARWLTHRLSRKPEASVTGNRHSGGQAADNLPSNGRRSGGSALGPPPSPACRKDQIRSSGRNPVTPAALRSPLGAVPSRLREWHAPGGGGRSGTEREGRSFACVQLSR
jgi:hypothetical protein